ncbi:MAG: homoserine dehydrogenase [Caldilineaceae bacterium]
MTTTIKCALVGLGNVGRSFLQILEEKEQRLADQYGLRFQVVLVADSSGVAVCDTGFDVAALRRHKLDGGRVAGLSEFVDGHTTQEALQRCDCDLVLDASPVNLKDGEPGLGVVRAALRRGIHVVLANKAPLVLAFQELHLLAAQHNARLRYSATVCGALPVINIGRRDLIAADITKVRGIFNSTSNYILEEMSSGRSYAEALAEAQARGIAETDPSLDVEGWDTANKLVIIANSFLGVEAQLADVQVQGIIDIGQDALASAIAEDRRIKLVAEALRTETGYTLSVAPQSLDADDFLACCSSWEMGIEIHSDLYEIMYHKIWEAEPLPTAAAMLRGAVNIWHSL